MDTNSILIILPAAGKGTRLGLNYPKELYKINNNTSLIDFSLKHIIEFSKRSQLSVDLKVCVVVTRDKESVYRYVKESLYPITTERIYYIDEYPEWPGSVYSVKDNFSSYNLVLLPDSFLSLGKDRYWLGSIDQTLIETCIKVLKNSSVVFGYIKTIEKSILKNLGAIKSVGDKINLFYDKPIRDLDKYNGFWGCYGFRKDEARELYDFLTASVHHEEKSYVQRSFYPAAGIKLFEYYDLGVWDSINQFKTNKKNLLENFQLYSD